MGIANQTILIADDNEAMLHAVARVMRHAEFEVMESRTGPETLDLARSAHPDLILLDVNLPGMSGFEVSRLIKGDPELSDIFVVHLSALRTDAQSTVLGYEGGADGYITQPVENRELVARVSGYLRHKKALDDLRESERRYRERYENECKALEEIVRQRQSARRPGEPSHLLQETAPAVFETLRGRYQELLEMALEGRIYKVEHDVSGGLRQVADRLFVLGATPRDVIQIHSCALIRLVPNPEAPKAQGYLEAGRLLLIELMGCLTSAYRGFMIEHSGRTIESQSSVS